MARGQKTGGRQKGSRNKATAAKEKEIAKSGKTPLEFMLDVMRNQGQDEAVRLDAAKAAAPYVHPRLAAIEHTGKDGKDLIPVSENEVARRLAFALELGLRAAQKKD